MSDTSPRLIMSNEQDRPEAPPKPITITRAEADVDISSPLGSFLVEKKRKRGNSYCPDGDFFREVGKEQQGEQQEK